MNKRLVITSAVGLVLSATAFAQTPNDRSRERTQTPSATTTTPSTSTTAPSTSSPNAQSAPARGTTAQSPAPATNSTTMQTQAPAASGTTPSQSSQPANPSTAQTPSTQQPARNQAQTPAPANQPSTAQSPAQTTQPGTAQTPAPAANQPSTAQTPSANTNVNASVNIGATEQTRISQSIARLNVQPLTNVNFSVAVGTTIPRNVRLQTLPPDIVSIVPQYRGHGFVVVRNEIVIVEPSTQRIVAVLPRSGARAAAAPGPTQKKVTFSEKDRAAIRKHTRSSRETVTTGSTARAQMRVGDRVPDTVELIEFPSTVYRAVPSVREYRYIQRESRSYLVEPWGRTIIEEID